MCTFAVMNTPIYIIEEEKLRKNLTLISEVARRTQSEWILAFKAFALWKTFPIFREYIHSTTASSLSEARLALEEFGAKAHTYSPAYKDEEFDEIVRCSSHLTFNSLSQYERFHERAGECSLGLRVNPEYSEVGTMLYNPCAPGTRFGVTADKLPEQLPADISGFHCHCHCESGSDVFERTLTHIEEKFSKWFGQIKWINFGGGHLVTRKDYDIERLVRLFVCREKGENARVRNRNQFFSFDLEGNADSLFLTISKQQVILFPLSAIFLIENVDIQHAAPGAFSLPVLL